MKTWLWRWIRRAMGLGVLGLGLWMLAAALMPFPHEKLQQHPRNTRYLDSGGGLLRRTLGEGGVDSDWISLAETGAWAGPALIAVEDQRFYTHAGVDPVALGRATLQNIGSGRVVSGASTLSTQVIRMMDPWRDRSLSTKFIEFFRATQLEMRYDKDFILEQYLNRAPMGGNRYGIASGARRYFGKEPENLSVGEAALLMGLPQSPSRYRPNRYPERAERRRETVLRRMQEEGMLMDEPLLDFGPRWVEPPLRAYHFTEWVRQRHGHQTGNLHTTLDATKQAACEAGIQGLMSDPRYAETDGVGVVLLDARTGRVRAWVGAWNPDDPLHSQVDTVTRRRAPGSTLKPFAYALAMQRGWLTPDTVLDDRPRVYRDYHPANMEENWSGDVTARDALVRSLNLPALQVVERTGVGPFLGLLRTSGLSLEGVQPAEVGLGAVLGGGMEVSLLDLTSAYTLFANQGQPLRPTALETDPPVGASAIAPGVAYWMGQMLSGDERDEMLYGNRADVNRPSLAFKTGTSHGLRDAWAIGWNGDWVLGVWVGRLDGESVAGLSGSTHAAPILGRLAQELFSPSSWPHPSGDVDSWDGREIVRGVTNPEVAPEAVERPVGRILSPLPDYEWRGLDAGPALISLKADVPRGGEVHWFVNGSWIGKAQSGAAIPHSFPPGRHQVRAVFPEGQAETRTVTIL